MAEQRRKAGDRVPTLTEVVELAPPPAPPPQAPRSAKVPVSSAGAPVASVAAASELTAEVLFELEQRIDSLFEARLREALAPALARAAEGLIRETRVELTSVLKAMVEDAVTRALERHTHL